MRANFIRDCRIEFGSVRAWRENRPRKRFAPNGSRECERRMAQIEAGSLKAENGLVIS